MKKSRGKPAVLLGIIITAASVIGRMVIAGRKMELVIYHGIAAYRSYLNAANIAFVAGLVLTAAGFIFLFISGGARRAVKKQEEASEMSSREKKKSYSPEDVRASIKVFQQKYPDFPLERCVEQLDQMDNYQHRLRELLDRNDLEAFSNTEEILKDVEDELCRDIKSFTNYMIVSDDAEVMRNRYDSMLSRNEKRFGYVQELLITLADFVNENIKSEDAIEKITVCNDAIRDTFILL